MLRPRIIPCLLIHKKGLYKTVNFKDPKYVGDPINAVRIFNEKESDELMVIDIDASVKNLEPNFDLISKLAEECRMPLCYAGGVKNIKQAKKIFSLGVEKIGLSSVIFENEKIIKDMSEQVGSQSVIVIIDYIKSLFGYKIYTHNGKINQNINIFKLVKKVESLGAGEIVLNSIDRDGMMNGYDIELAEKIRKIISIPITILGGGGSHEDIKKLIKKQPYIGVAAGSLFVFKGPYRAVLINYPSHFEKENIIN